jgi:hypothetical protein
VSACDGWRATHQQQVDNHAVKLKQVRVRCKALQVLRCSPFGQGNSPRLNICGIPATGSSIRTNELQRRTTDGEHSHCAEGLDEAQLLGNAMWVEHEGHGDRKGAGESHRHHAQH